MVAPPAPRNFGLLFFVSCVPGLVVWGPWFVQGVVTGLPRAAGAGGRGRAPRSASGAVTLAKFQ